MWLFVYVHCFGQFDNGQKGPKLSRDYSVSEMSTYDCVYHFSQIWNSKVCVTAWWWKLRKLSRDLQNTIMNIINTLSPSLLFFTLPLLPPPPFPQVQVQGWSSTRTKLDVILVAVVRTVWMLPILWVATSVTATPATSWMGLTSSLA